MKNHQNQVNTIIGNIVKYSGMFYLIFLLSSCASVAPQADMKMAMTYETISMQEKISAHDLHKILTSRFGYVRIKLSDSEYTLPDNDKVARLWNSVHGYSDPGAGDTVEQADWSSDDYAIAAMAPLRNYAFGAMFVTTASGEHHVINLFVNDRKEIVFWDSKNSQHYQGQLNKPELILI